MTDVSDLRARLLDAFVALGVENPESWVDSQTQEGIPQLHRAAFLAKAWSAIPDGTSTTWIDASLKSYERDPNGAYAGAGKAIRSLQKKGATTAELTDLVRATQAELLSHVMYLLSDPGFIPDERFEHPLIERVGWALVALDDDEPTGDLIDGLHESVLEMDPLGREVGPIDP